MVSLGVASWNGSAAGSHDDKVPYSCPMLYEKPSWIVAGRGFMEWEVGVVQRPADAMASFLIDMSLLFIVKIGVGRFAVSRLNLLFGLNGKDCVCNWFSLRREDIV